MATQDGIDLTDQIIDFECGELSEGEIIKLFAELISSGLAWKLQGYYGRTATALIDEGIISQAGKVLIDLDGGQ